MTTFSHNSQHKFDMSASEASTGRNQRNQAKYVVFSISILMLFLVSAKVYLELEAVTQTVRCRLDPFCGQRQDCGNDAPNATFNIMMICLASLNVYFALEVATDTTCIYLRRAPLGIKTSQDSNLVVTKASDKPGTSATEESKQPPMRPSPSFTHNVPVPCTKQPFDRPDAIEALESPAPSYVLTQVDKRNPVNQRKPSMSTRVEVPACSVSSDKASPTANV